MAISRPPATAKSKEKHVLILASGEKIRHMTIRPWLTGSALAAVSLLSLAYLGATTYLVLRDDLVGASMARQARMQHDYEDRISALRAQVDRITSRQLLDQQVVEQKVDKLMQQQFALTHRQGKLGSVMERAEGAGLTITPGDNQDHLDLDQSNAGDSMPKQGAAREGLAFAAPVPGATMADRADRLFSRVTLSLKEVERTQLQHIQDLTANATDRTEKIRTIIANTGLKLPVQVAAADQPADDTAIGGPYLAPEPADVFEQSLGELDLALDRFEKVKRLAMKLPLANPAPNREITSLFGNRIDPFFGKLALHAGIDFRQKEGGNVYATGAGTVVAAGPSGGYGNMVEIDHGNGISTRYGHLSRIDVKTGDHVDEGEVIALSGSTGRSTGPHLHYEVRLNDVAVDPMRFLNAGLKLDTYIR